MSTIINNVKVQIGQSSNFHRFPLEGSDFATLQEKLEEVAEQGVVSKDDAPLGCERVFIYGADAEQLGWL